MKQDASVMTDEHKGYNDVSKIYDHDFVKHSLGEYVKDNVYTNTVEGFWSLLKRSIVGIYHTISKKHLQKYVDESVFRYNFKSCNENILFVFPIWI